MKQEGPVSITFTSMLHDAFKEAIRPETPEDRLKSYMEKVIKEKEAIIDKIDRSKKQSKKEYQDSY